MISAILIDDEINCLDTLNILLEEYCPEVQVIEQCPSGQKGLEAITKHHPDLVFLDIEMPVLNGFELLEQLNEINFSVIFTTGYNQYAIKAIRFSALDYLMKPIDPKELVAAVHKVGIQRPRPEEEQLTMLMERIKKSERAITKLALPTSNGFELFPANMILYCEANDNYTHLYLKDKRKLTACRTLKEIEEQLQEFSHFIRVHRSYIVNLNEVSRYIMGDGGYLVLNDETRVNVSRNRKESLLKILKF